MHPIRAKLIVKRFVRLTGQRADLIRQLASEPDNSFLRGMYRVYDQAFLDASAAYDALPFQFKTVARY